MLRRTIIALGLALAWLAPTSGLAAGECRPQDEYSEKIDSVLRAVEGPGFPSPENLEAWQRRRGTIHAGFSDIVRLADGDAERRSAAVHGLIAAQSLSATPKEAHMLGTGLERGEIRAWARRVLKDFSSIGLGLTGADGQYVDAELITELDEAWSHQDQSQVERSLPVYQKKAAALRGLARFEPPDCNGSESP